jgi:hypothetical protein
LSGPDWLPLNAAFARIYFYVRSRPLAANDLHRQLLTGQLRSGVRQFEPNVRGTETSARLLEPEFWKEAILQEAPLEPWRDEGNFNCVDIQWKGNKEISGEWFFVIYRPDLDKLYPDGPVSDQPSTAQLEPAPLKSTRGAKAAYDWEKILIGAAVVLIRDGVPQSADKLVEQVLKNFHWSIGEPAKSELNKHMTHSILL